ncbi:MAG: hypothetical protein ACREQI_01395 [Candidatus Binataceae bacterium]
MTAEHSISEAAQLILAQPAPLLFLDTCAVFDVLRLASEREGQPERILAATERILAMASAPARGLWILSASIIDTEWRDNVQTVIDGVRAHITRVDRSLVKLHAAIRATKFTQASLRRGDPAAIEIGQLPQIEQFGLPERLLEICERIMASAVWLPPDDAILRATHLRSTDRRKPAARGKRETPDCQIIETYFALCRALRSRGFEERCVFASSNKSDFYGEGEPLPPHEELAAECNEVNLQFAVAFDHALSILYSSGTAETT